MSVRWHRIEPGRYVAGPYSVENVNGWWYAHGPGDVNSAHQRKDLAQACCVRAAERRAGDPASEPVTGDAVTINGQDRRGRLGVVLGTGEHRLYVVHFPRGRRLTLHRDEFSVVTP